MDLRSQRTSKGLSREVPRPRQWPTRTGRARKKAPTTNCCEREGCRKLAVTAQANSMLYDFSRASLRQAFAHATGAHLATQAARAEGVRRRQARRLRGCASERMPGPSGAAIRLVGAMTAVLAPRPRGHRRGRFAGDMVFEGRAEADDLRKGGRSRQRDRRRDDRSVWCRRISTCDIRHVAIRVSAPQRCGHHAAVAAGPPGTVATRCSGPPPVAAGGSSHGVGVRLCASPEGR